MEGLAPDILAHLGSFPITNTFITTLIVDVLLLVGVFAIYKGLKLIPKSFLQNGIEMTIEYFYNVTEQVAGKNVNAIFPWALSFFLFIAVSNILGLLPGFGSIGFFKGKELIPLFRASTSDFNTTFALAIVSFFATQIIAIRSNGFKGYTGHFFNFSSLALAPVFLFVGFLEIISEFTKMFSLAFRLFGNIYAGEIVMGTISSIFGLLAPIPFLMLESIVALVQALVFAMLTMAFMSALAGSHEGGDH